jgi:hypothetical protein
MQKVEGSSPFIRSYKPRFLSGVFHSAPRDVTFTSRLRRGVTLLVAINAGGVGT